MSAKMLKNTQFYSTGSQIEKIVSPQPNENDSVE